ncbi:ArsR/SmtB family transcription factor [Vaginisenegalia massiliensis]|uniref:ArsR/SmtB family transcription factor n=1 Tax=Vaginisenegalia massiliensis TaxID=2058294 RepID=UPI000F540B5E|nr:metalloregulator ArsR/SmtB family transcription factor [Vaginisenegalia massiliensis]
MADYECLETYQLDKESDKLQDVLTDDRLAIKANIFKVLGDLNRIKIMNVLMNYERLCVYEISRLIDASVATTSHHLITLRSVNLIKSQKEGKHVIYSLNCDYIGKLFNFASTSVMSCNKLKAAIEAQANKD